METTTHSGAAGVSDRGSRRGVNADAMALTTAGSWTIGVVCDGVSMAPRADRAARVAAETGARVLATRLREGTLPEYALSEAAALAGRAVAALAGTESVAPACTYVAGIAGAEGVWAAGIGDSRAHWIPDEGPGMVLTEDDADEHDVLTAWLGAGAGEPAPRVRSYRPAVPGRLMLCTDGLWRCLPGFAEGGGARAIHDRGSVVVAELLDDARSLVGRALDAGGHDNITVVLIPVTPGAPTRSDSG
ncbi:PP2C family protein-serine/threonine phosphatase [Streptomyces sp. NPDC059175]|uniref:PP2C family protein-serine/threonine phosphatase n=1 Tax=Streptomyces sp. NPDC059175 TaxID=3346757 RepID=UPI003682B547